MPVPVVRATCLAARERREPDLLGCFARGGGILKSQAPSLEEGVGKPTRKNILCVSQLVE